MGLTGFQLVSFKDEDEYINDLSSNVNGHNQNGQSSSGNIYTYDANGNLKSDAYRSVSNINYNYLDLPVLIQRSNGSKLEMTYDANGHLLTRKTYTTGSVLSKTRDFIGNYEFKNSVIDIVHHAQGYLQRIGSNNFKHRYVIKDHLGSTRIVYHDDSGNGTVEQSEIIDENHYYAYGMEYTGGINSIGYAYKFNGIERVEAFQSDFAFYRGLDPILGRWYQVDPKAEAVMGMRPYCAMGNNPVSYSDPEGDLPFLVLALGAATSVFSNGLSNISNGQNFFAGAGKAAFWGAVGAGASLGVGAAFGATGSIGHELLRSGAHAATQGGISAAQGGNFWQGALSGGIGSGISSGIAALGGAAGHQILGGGLGGGIGSAMSGGNFWQGLGQGIAVGAFNHALHSGLSGGPDDPPRTKEELKIGIKLALDQGSITLQEYNTTLNYLDNGNSGVIGSVLWDNKVEIGSLAIGGVFGVLSKSTSFGAWAFNSKLIGYQSKLFGRFHSQHLPNGFQGYLNRLNIRIGWGTHGGRHVFRAAIGKPHTYNKWDILRGPKF
ncbi:MAG: hypothetical protein IPM42_13320 [Saprospiraceae bacterium]|nr:hypothetical protein [Saprospiraceae bacterium]